MRMSLSNTLTRTPIPSLFVGGEKYYEAQPGHDYETILAAVRVAFDTITKS